MALDTAAAGVMNPSVAAVDAVLDGEFVDMKTKMCLRIVEEESLFCC